MSDKSIQVRDFSQVLSLYLHQREIRTQDAYRLLKENGIKVSQSVFYEYVAGTAVPTFERAKEILNGLGIIMDDPMLLTQTLDASRNSETYISSRHNTEIYTLSGSFKIPWRSLALNDTESTRSIRDRLDRRVEMTANNFSDYLAKLISADLNQGVLEPLQNDKQNNGSNTS